MFKDWKMIAVSSGIAFLLSFVSGFIGGVSFGVVLLRAVMGGVIFGVLALGISFLIHRFLPELFEIQQAGTEETENHQNVDPSVVQETDIAEAGGSQVDISIGDSDDQPVEVQEAVFGETDTVNTESDTVEMVEEIVESGDDDSAAGSGQVPPGLDVLPDMGVFSGSFSGSEESEMSGSVGSGPATLDIMGVEQDPELVVRAVRTMVKKDQEG